MNNEPIKRHTALQPVSREHHHGLQLCWKIRTGFNRSVDVSRMRKYAVWFYDNHLSSHFDVEEKYIFPVLGNDNSLVKRALSEHRKIRRLIQAETELYKSLNALEEIIEKHIRFEERILFNEVQSVATTDQLQKIALYHSDTNFADNLTDIFWE